MCNSHNVDDREALNQDDRRGFLKAGAAVGAGVALAGTTATANAAAEDYDCLLYTSPSPRDRQKSRMPSSA